MGVIETKLEATTGFEPVNKGFANPRLNHLATSPLLSIPRSVLFYAKIKGDASHDRYRAAVTQC